MSDRPAYARSIDAAAGMMAKLDGVSLEPAELIALAQVAATIALAHAVADLPNPNERTA
jgi:hypothetical protein